MINLHDIECPYGAENCPKVNQLTKMLENNRKELDEVKRSVIQLDTTIKTWSKIIGALVSILIALIGVYQI